MKAIVLMFYLTSPMQAEISAWAWAIKHKIVPVYVACVEKKMIRVPCEVTAEDTKYQMTCTFKSCGQVTVVPRW